MYNYQNFYATYAKLKCLEDIVANSLGTPHVWEIDKSFCSIAVAFVEGKALMSTCSRGAELFHIEESGANFVLAVVDRDHHIFFTVFRDSIVFE